MGDRACFVLVDGSGWELHYSHWAANRMVGVLAAGPGAATDFIAAQQRRDPATGWLDSNWAEGGAVVDHPARRLVFYGGGWLTEPPVRRAFLDLLSRTWPDWHVAWAYDGIGDLAAHVGVDRAPLTVPDEEERFRPGRTMTAEQLEANPCHLLTVRHTTGALTVHPLTPICHIAWQGPGLLDDLPGPGVSGLVLAEPPESGTHIDVAAHRVGVWIGYHATGLVPSLPRLWPGWHVDFWDDRWEEQLARCGDAVRAPATDPIEAVDRLAEAIDDDIAHDPLPGMLDLAHAEGPEGTTRVLDPHLTAHVHTPPPPDALHHLHTALAALRHEATRPR